MHNESFFFFFDLLLFLFIDFYICAQNVGGGGEGNIIFAKIEFFLEIFIGYQTCHGPCSSARTSANIRSLAD